MGLNYKKYFVFIPVTIITIIVGCACELYNNKEKRIIESISHFSKSIDYDNMATSIINKGDQFSIINGKESTEMSNFLEKALMEAKQVDIDILNSEYPEWGSKYKDYYIQGMELIILGHKNVNASQSLQGQLKVSIFKNWFENNANEIRRLHNR